MDGLLLISILAEPVSAVISFAIGYYAYKGFRISSARRLFLLHLGFVILGVALLLRFITFGFLLSLRFSEQNVQAVRGIISLGGFVFSSLQLAAYILFSVSYTSQPESVDGNGKTLAVLPSFYLIFFNPFLELLSLAILGYVVARALILFIYKSGGNSLLVLLGFACFFISHLFFLFATVDESLLFLGQIIQLFGFIFFLVMLTRVTRTG
ncbi:MAG: hypothetical protein QXO47_07420 [Thermoproteota archaeon]|nr:hypothetical protein [Candidatus Brockarchaeota archaeon]